MNRDRPVLIGGLALVVAGLLGWSVSGSGPAPAGWSDPMSRMPMMDRMAGTIAPAFPGAKEVTVRLEEFAFTPAEVIVEAGRDFNLALVNEGKMVHDLTIPSLGASIVVPPGGRASVVLPALAPGSYPFACTVPGHAEAGMTGTLIVQETQDGG